MRDEGKTSGGEQKVRGRLAPSPTGALHLGNARSFLIAWLSVRSRRGQMVLRMEDLDHPKVKPQAAEEALEDLRWLGIDWDEGPDIGGPCAPYVQSQRRGLYRAALAGLSILENIDTSETFLTEVFTDDGNKVVEMLLVLQLRHFRGEIIKTQFNIIQFHVLIPYYINQLDLSEGRNPQVLQLR